MRGLAGVLGVALCAGCGGGSANPDATPGLDDDAEPGSCSDPLSYQVEVFDSETGLGVPFADLSVLGDPEVTASTAPNGRAVLELCLDGVTEFAMSIEEAAHVTRIENLSAAALKTHYAIEDNYRIIMYTPTAADAQIPVTRNPLRSDLHLHVLRYPGATPEPLAAVTITADHEGSYQVTDGGVASASAVTGANGRLYFRNVDATTTLLAVTPPNDVGACLAPSSILMQPGSISGALIACPE